MSSQLSEQQQGTQARGGRFDLDNTIRIKESYIYVFPEVHLNKLITDYIVEKDKKSRYKEGALCESYLLSKIQEKQNNYFQQLSNYQGQMSVETLTQTYYAKIFEIADFFQNFLSQCPNDDSINQKETKKSVLDKSIGKKEWNELLAGTSRAIPSNIMETILSQQYSEEHIFALALLFIYSISNEDIAEKIFSVIIDLYDISSQNALKIDDKIIKMLIQFFVCLILRMNHHNQTSPSAESIKNIYKRINDKFSFTLGSDYTITVLNHIPQNNQNAFNNNNNSRNIIQNNNIFNIQ